MADVAVVEDEKQSALAFNSGFDTETPLDPPAAKKEPEKKDEPVAKDEPKVEAKAEIKTDPAPPKYVKITQDELDSLKTAAGKMLTPEKVKDIVSGTLGELEQRIVKKLQTQTPVGEPVKVSKVTLAKLRADFPDLADLLENDLEDHLKGLRGTGPAEAPGAAADPEAVQKLVNDAMEAAHTRREIKALEKAHPKWREIVGAIDSEGKFDPNNPFRVWLAKQPADYQHAVNNADEASDVRDAIDKFHADTKGQAKQPTPALKDAARIDRIKEAIQPRGDGRQVSAETKSETDHFNDGFANG